MHSARTSTIKSSTVLTMVLMLLLPFPTTWSQNGTSDSSLLSRSLCHSSRDCYACIVLLYLDSLVALCPLCLIMLHHSAHILLAHRHFFWHAPWSKCNYLPLSNNHIPAKVDHLSYDATIWVLHWSFTINPPSTHSSSSHTFTALQLSYTRMSLPSIQHKLLATSCQSGTDLQLCPAHQSWPRPSLLHLMVVWKAPLAGSYGWKINEKSGIILFCCACPVNGGNY
jgi:hypothetical protein